MKKLFALLLILALVGCATVPIAKGTVLEKFARGGYSELWVINGMPISAGHLPTYWVSIRGNGCRIEVPLMKERWDAVQVGDVILLNDGDEGGGA